MRCVRTEVVPGVSVVLSRRRGTCFTSKTVKPVHTSFPRSGPWNAAWDCRTQNGKGTGWNNKCGDHQYIGQYILFMLSLVYEKKVPSIERVFLLVFVVPRLIPSIWWAGSRFSWSIHCSPCDFHPSLNSRVRGPPFEPGIGNYIRNIPSPRMRTKAGTELECVSSNGYCREQTAGTGHNDTTDEIINK